ncbi:MAG: ATP phosphoribosyltransferase regulatory subunit [Burkholderiaceae bacterium]
MPNWLLPENLSDALPSEARRIEELRRQLLDLYRIYGYELIAPPLIEHLDSLLTGSGSQLAMRTFQTVDQLSGKTLGIRADMTPQAARIDAHNLNRTGVSRLCYAGPVLHTRPASALATREPFQVGAELFGHGGIEAELEVIDLMIESLQAAGVTQIRIDMGHAAIVPAVLDTMRRRCPEPYEAVDIDMVYQLLVQKDQAGLRVLLAGWPAPIVSAMTSLTTLYGPVAQGDVGVVDQAVAVLPADPAIDDALARLRAVIASSLWERHPGVSLAIDLADLQGYHYYTGVCFTAFASPANGVDAHGQALARGGRYDGVGKAFGRDRAAAGFSLELRLLAALGNGAHNQVDAGQRCAVRAPWSDDPGLRAAVARLRDQGEIVVQIFPGHEQEQDEFACDRELTLRDKQWILVDI